MCSSLRSLDRRDRLGAATLMAVVLLAGFWRMVPGVCGTFHDDAVYVSTAKALAEGDGYRLIHLPGSPIQTKYPIAYPALLAIVWKVWPSFPENVVAMQYVTLMAGALTVGLAYLYLVRFKYCSRGAAMTGGLICGTAPQMLFFCTGTLSEVPFALLLLAALWRLDGELQAPVRGRTGQLLLGFLLALPFLCRTVGAVLVPVALTMLYFRGRSVRWISVGRRCRGAPLAELGPGRLWSLGP